VSMNDAMKARFQASLERAARKAGIDLTGLKFEQCTTDRTWGDRVGQVFYGASPEVNERAARFFLEWIQKQPHVGNYEAQRSRSYQGAMYYRKFSNGAGGWDKSPLKPYAEYTLPSGFVMSVVEERTGVAVNTTYFPCAD
jgi:hypothetical protein